MTSSSLDLNNPTIKHQISQKLLDLQVCQNQKLDINTALIECRADHQGPQFWQTPSFVIGGFVVTVATTTIVVCLTHLMGACQ